MQVGFALRLFNKLSRRTATAQAVVVLAALKPELIASVYGAFPYGGSHEHSTFFEATEVMTHLSLQLVEACNNECDYCPDQVNRVEHCRAQCWSDEVWGRTID
jgi:hypothetical protein